MPEFEQAKLAVRRGVCQSRVLAESQNIEPANAASGRRPKERLNPAPMARLRAGAAAILGMAGLAALWPTVAALLRG